MISDCDIVIDDNESISDYWDYIWIVDVSLGFAYYIVDIILDVGQWCVITAQEMRGREEFAFFWLRFLSFLMFTDRAYENVTLAMG